MLIKLVPYAPFKMYQVPNCIFHLYVTIGPQKIVQLNSAWALRVNANARVRNWVDTQNVGQRKTFTVETFQVTGQVSSSVYNNKLLFCSLQTTRTAPAGL